MFSKGQPLISPADFDNAMFFGAIVEAWQRGELLDDGIIDKHTEIAVHMDGGYFLKGTCQFKIRETRFKVR